MSLLRRTLADIACAVLCIVAWVLLLPLVVWRGVRGGWHKESRATRALLLVDLALGELLGADRGAVCILVTLGVEQRTWHTIGMVPIRKPYALMWWAACALCLVAAGISLPGERPWLAYAPAAVLLQCRRARR